jgi:hypothetical protein
MTEVEQQALYEAIKRNAPEWYRKTVERLNQKRAIVSSCLKLATHSDDSGYQKEINRTYNDAGCLLNDTETILLNYLCLIKHKEHINGRIKKDDEDIQKWIMVLEKFIKSDEPIISLLDKTTRKILDKYKIKAIGRPKGKGKQVFLYNDKEYHTIQQCANDYDISKQAMHKKLKKLQII